MTPPFFSILLPTRNRSSILGDAIQSALAQSFSDFELIISDNDESSTATAEVVSQFQDPRVRYFRTSGDLPMHENWENAFSQARGRHVLVLEDKVRMVPNALQILHQHLKELGDVVISFGLGFAKGEVIDPPGDSVSARRFSSIEAIDLFCTFQQKSFTLLPKGLDSCAPRALLQKVKDESPTGLLFSYISPDYASGFMILAKVPEFYRIDENLFYIPNNWMWKGQFSNGQASYKRTEAYKGFLKTLPVRREQILEKVPAKTEFLWINSVIYDFLTLYQRADHHPFISWVDYFAFCKVLVLIGWKLGADMTEQKGAIQAALQKQSPYFRFQVQINFIRRGFGLGLQSLKGILG